MDITVIEDIFRFIIMMEFALIALAGAAAFAHVIMMDAELRKMTIEQQAILDGISDAADAKTSEHEAKRQAKLARLEARHQVTAPH